MVRRLALGMECVCVGRRAMIQAFVRVSDAARRAGVDERWISVEHGVFFDGNVVVKAGCGCVPDKVLDTGLAG